MSETLFQAQRNKEETGEHHHASLGTAVRPSGTGMGAFRSSGTAGGPSGTAVRPSGTAVMSAGGCVGGGTHGR